MRSDRSGSQRLAWRLVLRALLVTVITVGGVALLSYQLVLIAGRSDVDRLLRDEADAVATTFADRLPDAAGLDGVLADPEAERAARQTLAVHPSSARHVSVIRLDGVRLQSSGGPSRVAALLRGRDAPAPDAGRIRSVDTSIGPVRVLDADVVGPGGDSIAVVTVAAPLDQSRDTATSVLWRVLIASAIGVACGAAALTVVVRRSLGPLRDVSAATAAISPDDLTSRVAVPPTSDEVSELATEFNHMLSRLEAAETGRRRYLASISHEVRTPLAVARGHLELLEAPGTSEDDARQAAATVRQELDRLGRVLDDLMAVARGNEEIDVRRDAVFLPDLFHAVAERVATLHVAAPVIFEPAPPLVVLGDQARLEQCLTNLISNAVDHNPPGTRVRIGGRDNGRRIELTVGDDGPGVDPELLPHVFEPFVTTRPDSTTRASGLGLAVVRSLVQAQGGTVAMDSNPAGTTVTIALPRARA